MGVFVVRITKKQIIAGIPNLVLLMYLKYECHKKSFTKVCKFERSFAIVGLAQNLETWDIEDSTEVAQRYCSTLPECYLWMAHIDSK